jgi:hypothetical protein
MPARGGGPDDREVPVVKRGDPGQPEALSDGRHSGIDDAKRKIKISILRFRAVIPGRMRADQSGSWPQSGLR